MGLGGMGLGGAVELYLMADRKQIFKNILKSLLCKLIPILVSAGLLIYVFHDVPFDKVAEAIKRCNLPLLITMTASLVGMGFLLDCAALYYTLKWMGFPARFRDALPMQGASNILTVINASIGIGGIVYYIHRVKKIPFMKALSGVLFMVGWEFYIVVFLCTYGLFFEGIKVAQLATMRTVCIIIIMTLIPYILFVFQPFSRLTGRELTPGFLKKIRAWKLFYFLEWADLRCHLKLIALKIPMFMLTIVGHYFSLHLFNVEVPFHVAMAFAPVILLLRVVPISFHGWGVTQLGALALFKEYGTPENILAYSVMANFLVLIINLAIGAIFMRRAYRDLMKSPGLPVNQGDSKGA